jgi:hypothetical protein
MRAVYDKQGKNKVGCFFVSLDDLSKLASNRLKEPRAGSRMPLLSLRMSLAASALWIGCVPRLLPHNSQLIIAIQIGEISLLKEMTSAAEVMMSDDERAAVAAETGSPSRSASPNPQAGTSATPAHSAADNTTTPSQANIGNNVGPMPPNITTDSAKPTRSDSGVVKHEGSGAATPSSTGGKDKDKKGKNKLSPEQKKKLEELDAQRRKVMEERYVMG